MNDSHDSILGSTKSFPDGRMEGDISKQLLKRGISFRWVGIFEDYGLRSLSDLKKITRHSQVVETIQEQMNDDEKNVFMELIDECKNTVGNSGPDEQRFRKPDGSTNKNTNIEEKRKEANRNKKYDLSSKSEEEQVYFGIAKKQVDTTLGGHVKEKNLNSLEWEERDSGSKRTPCQARDNLNSPEGVTYYQNESFQGRDNLNSPEGVTYQKESYQGRDNLNSPEGVTYQKEKENGITVSQQDAHDENNLNSISTDEYKELLEKLGLAKYFPGKITVQMAMEKFSNNLESLTDSPWYFLTKMILLDYRGRDHMVPQNVKSESESIKKTSYNDESEVDLDDLLADFNELSIHQETPSTAPHPLDVLNLTFMCCSNDLRQILCEKMFACKLSIPLLLPSDLTGEFLFLNWSLRNIVVKSKKSDGEIYEHSIVDHPISVVSCLRFGKIFRSKSKFLNEILNNQSHPTFYHRDCEGAMSRRLSSEGTVEVAWRLPKSDMETTETKTESVKQKRLLFEMSQVSILNLRGDGMLQDTCRKFLCTISDVVLVMVDVCELENLDVVDTLKCMSSNRDNFILILTKQPNVNLTPGKIKNCIKSCMQEMGNDKFKKMSIVLDFVGNEEKNIKVLTSDVVDKLSKCLEENPTNKPLANYVELLKSLPITVDETGKHCREGRKRAWKTKETACQGDSNSLTTSKLPLQSKPWQEWAKLNKEQHRKKQHDKNKNLEEYMNEIRVKKQAQRMEQVYKLQKPTRLFTDFLQNILSLKEEEMHYYIKWLKLFLDDISRQRLPGRQEKCVSKWNEIRLCKDKVKLQKLQNELNQLEKELSESSFGLEHFFREICQAYEAVMDVGDMVSKEVKEGIYRLPKIMAKLLLQGYPLELMDGDAGSIPINWIEKVLEHLAESIGDKKIFVISVLGIQSSGKSTMLNTMFGLQFAVSAGRCTRGVYVQLLPVPNEYSNGNYDYILVVDTEGLRAAELAGDKMEHDNELATLVVGLGDVTLVNFKGENVTEMEDVLQIVIHALLKMKLVNNDIALQPSCFFIHQNVSEADASKKLRSGQQRFIETLDNMTRAAGIQEGMTSYAKFSQVIEFDINTNIFYFSDLWRGDPPMGHANPGYSECVNKVKHTLLTEVTQRRTSYLDIKKFSKKVKDLWKGILEQNFVFSFKNTLQMEAYNSLEDRFSNLLWELKQEAVIWQSKKEKEIMSSAGGLSVLRDDLQTECNKHLEPFYLEAKKTLEKRFEEGEDKAIIENWRIGTFLNLMNDFKDVIHRTVEALKINIQIRQIQIDQEKDNDDGKYKYDIMKKAKQTAEDLRSRNSGNSLTDKELERIFSEKWEEWLKKLGQTDKMNTDIESIAINILYNMFPQDRPLVTKVVFTMILMGKANFHDIFSRFIYDKGGYTGIFLNFWASVKAKTDTALQDVKQRINATNLNQFESRNALWKCLVTKAKWLGKQLKLRSLDEEVEIFVLMWMCQYATAKIKGEQVMQGGDHKLHNMFSIGIHPYFEERLRCAYAFKLLPVQQKILLYTQSTVDHNKGMLLICTKYVELHNLEEAVKVYAEAPEIQCFREENIEEIIKKTYSVLKNWNIGKEMKLCIAVHMCAIATPVLIRKHTQFLQRLDPRKVFTEKYHRIYLREFQNCYNAITGEHALSLVLSEKLCQAIEDAVSKDIVQLLADDVRDRVNEVRNKPALLKAILTKLLELNDFEEFEIYLDNANGCFEKWIVHFIDEYLFSNQKGGTPYTVIAFKLIDRVMSTVCKDISDTISNISEDEYALHQWIEKFQKKVMSNLTITLQELLSLIHDNTIHNLASFTEQLQKDLRATQKKLREIFQQHGSSYLRNANGKNLYQIFYDECKGCTAKCPFCSSPCTRIAAGHTKTENYVKHVTREHYPQACGGWRWLNSEELITENCPTLIGGDRKFRCPQTNNEFHPYQKYEDYFPNWEIDGDASVDASPYWKWFLVNHQDALVKKYQVKSPKIPDSWYTITIDEVRKSVKPTEKSKSS